MSKTAPVKPGDFGLSSVPAFWPMVMAAALWEQGAQLIAKNLKFVEEDIKIHGDLRPRLATPNTVRLELRTMTLRDYGHPGGMPTLVDAPHAGHTAMIADYHKGQSLVETLLSHGVGHVALTDWKPATEDMKDLEIDNYLAEVIVAIDDLGGRVNLVGLCQGGWVAAMVAARFPDKVNSLVLAGAPIDTDAGDGPVMRMAHASPASFYEELVALGGGLMKGKFMLQGWKNMHPGQHYVQDHLELYEHIDDPAYLAKQETFESWYENPIDLPGRWYLQVITQLFKENRLAKGQFVGLGRRLDLRDIKCPAYLLAGGGRRHHAARAGARRREVHRHAARADRAQDCAGRTYRAVHGRAHAQRALAGRRALDRGAALTLTPPRSTVQRGSKFDSKPAHTRS